jgi:hypothetical protein
MSDNVALIRQYHMEDGYALAYVARRRRILDHMLRKDHMLQDGHGDSEEVQEEEEEEEHAGDLA